MYFAKNVKSHDTVALSSYTTSAVDISKSNPYLKGLHNVLNAVRKKQNSTQRVRSRMSDLAKEMFHHQPPAKSPREQMQFPVQLHNGTGL